MLIDSRQLTGAAGLDCDVCIVGAGAAGITLARELIPSKRSIVLLESGGLERDEETQALYEGEATGNVLANPKGYLQTSRLRHFGGSTNHWAGYCRPLEALDFEARAWVADSGWPFTLEHLADYYRRALPILELPPFDDRVEASAKPPRAPLPLAADSPIRTSMIHFSGPTRFGTRYRSELERAENVRVLLHANALEFETDSLAGRVRQVRARCLAGREFPVRARLFVLATGGIENARMLLLSHRQHPSGLGNQYDLVGRYFMEHLSMTGGELIATVPPSGLALYERKRDPLGNHESLGLLSTTEDGQRDHSLLGFSARLIRAKPNTPARRALMQLLTRFDHLDDPPGTPRGAANASLRVVSEQSPNPASRVTLSGERDALGLNRVKLDWQVRSSDYRSVYDSLGLLGRELGRVSRGRVRLGVRYQEGELAPANNGGNHHMGTTRMHASPRQGVVDADCRVHGVPNLFVAGSSVFPTGGGEGTTTLTLVALALRLADRLAGELA